MTTEEALTRVRTAFDKATADGERLSWQILAGPDGEHYESFVLALLGYTNTLAGEVTFFEQLVEDYLQRDG